LGLQWIGEPIVYDNFDGFARLSAELKTPIQIGENFYGSRPGWLRTAATAGAAGVRTFEGRL
jgi:L-alanine-DL-glutamate epimerase-like enolase superfamily enzyme